MTRCVAIYARYSSSLQNQASVADQISECRDLAAKLYPKLRVREYADEKMSGAFDGNRVAFTQLMDDMRAGLVEAVLAWNQDRFARDEEATAKFYKLARFKGIQVATCTEGVLNNRLVVSVKAAMSAMYLDELSANVRRGINHKLKKGTFWGEAPYGYDATPGRGRKINEQEAAIGRRAFELYAAGLPAQKIAARFNEEGIPYRGGRKWAPTCLLGNAVMGKGILNNELYVGRFVWNRTRYVKNPETGERGPQMNPEDQWLRMDYPDLRIISDELWLAAKNTQATLAARVTGGHAFRLAKRPMHLFSGIVKCADCGRSYVSTGGRGGRMYCNGYRLGLGCSNSRPIDRAEIEGRIRQALMDRFMRPEALAAFNAFFEQFVVEENARRAAVDPKALARELVDVKAASNKALDLALAGIGDLTVLKERMRELDVRRTALEQAIAEAAAQQTRSEPRLHPHMAQEFATQVRTLYEALDNDSEVESVQARAAIRDLIDEVRIAHSGNEVSITLYGNLHRMLVAAGVTDTLRYTQLPAGACRSLCVIAA